jgi:cobalt-zinc-cadmium efflux system membrane fusion protein
MTIRWIPALIISALVSLGTPLRAEDEHGHSEPEEHAHEIGREHHDEGDGHDHGTEEDGHAHEDHSGHGHEEHGEGELELTPEAARMAGIRLARAGQGRIGTSIHVPGEVGFDEDRLVHVVPRYSGVTKEAHFRIGDRVRAGEIVAVVEGNESLSAYTIEAPISGWIIEKHVTAGEFVSEENPIYVIADLTHVWVNLAVYPKDAGKVKRGQEVTLHAIGSDQWTTGTIEYLTPVLDARTRSMTARIVLPNPDNTWRPGTFVHADIVAGRGAERLLVTKDAVQILDDEHVVFVPEGELRFAPRPVLVGESDDQFIEILGGLDEGMEYVAAGAFELKAKIVTSALGGHAGHGH